MLLSLRENRFFMGFIIPVAYQVFLAEAYLWIQPRQNPNIGVMLPFFFLLVPFVWFYMQSSKFLLFVSRLEHRYRETLRERIQSMVSSKDLGLSEEKSRELLECLEDELIPVLIENFRQQYQENYFTRPETVHHKRLTQHEAMLLFSVVFIAFSIIDLLTIIYLAFNPLLFDFFELDRIDNPINVLIFAGFFVMTIAFTVGLYMQERSELRVAILDTTPTLIPLIEKGHRHGKTFEYELEALRKFPLTDYLGEQLGENRYLVSELMKPFLQLPLTEALSEHVRTEKLHALVWRKYQELLDRFDFTDDQREELQERFFLPQHLIQAMRAIALNREEYEAIQMDLLHAKKKIQHWNELDKEEKVSTFVFLYRTAETLFRNVAVVLAGKQVLDNLTFQKLLSVLVSHRMLKYNETEDLRDIRRKRNALFHKSRTSVDIYKEDVETLLNIVEHFLERVARRQIVTD